jgi:hypothetical protein
MAQAGQSSRQSGDSDLRSRNGRAYRQAVSRHAGLVHQCPGGGGVRRRRFRRTHSWLVPDGRGKPFWSRSIPSKPATRFAGDCSPKWPAVTVSLPSSTDRAIIPRRFCFPPTNCVSSPAINWWCWPRSTACNGSSGARSHPRLSGFGGKSAEPRCVMFAGGNLIAQIVGCELSVARQVMEQLPTCIPCLLYRHQAHHLIRQLNRARVYSRLVTPASS